MVKVGRGTAALLLVGVGILVIVDKAAGSQYTLSLLGWWPVLLIGLGLEYLIAGLRSKGDSNLVRLDWAGMIVSVLLSGVVIGMTVGSSFVEKGMNYKWEEALSSFTNEGGQSYEKPAITVPVGSSIDKIKIDDTFGEVVLQSAPVDQMKVETTVWVNTDDKQEGESVAAQSQVDVSTRGSTISITAEGKSYGGGLFSSKRSRMNLVITIPEKQRVDVEATLNNGKLQATKLPIKERFSGRTSNGAIVISDLTGELDLETNNGRIEAANLNGSVRLKTSNGEISAMNVQGDAELKTSNGRVVSENVSGSLHVTTSNGTVAVANIGHRLNAKTNNGSIKVNSGIGDDWELDTSHGSIELILPEQSDAEVTGRGNYHSGSGSFPQIQKTDKHRLSGKLGSGRFKLDIETDGQITIAKKQ
jgi:DUF4097 and DUF4098 domain-containing protein YvlB